MVFKRSHNIWGYFTWHDLPVQDCQPVLTKKARPSPKKATESQTVAIKHTHIQMRNQLGTPGGAKSFLRVAQIFWTMSNIFERCPTHIPRDGEKFSRAPPGYRSAHIKQLCKHKTDIKTRQKHRCNIIPIFRSIFFPHDYTDVHLFLMKDIEHFYGNRKIFAIFFAPCLVIDFC